MFHAIIQEKNHRRHKADFGDAQVRVEISEETVEIFVEADFETSVEDFAILIISRWLHGFRPASSLRFVS